MTACGGNYKGNIKNKDPYGIFDMIDYFLDYILCLSFVEGSLRIKKFRTNDKLVTCKCDSPSSNM